MIEKRNHRSCECQRLRGIIREVGIPLRRLTDVVSGSPQQCLAWWSQQTNQIHINEKHFHNLATLIGISENELFDGTYDKNLARKRLFEDLKTLPERYLENQNSFLRNSAHIFKYMVLTRGQFFADQILTSMNLPPVIYQDADQAINLTYFADLLEILAKNGFSNDEMDMLGSILFLALQDTPLGIQFKNSESLFDVYSTLAANFNYFDTNFDYKNEFIGKKYILTTTLPLEQHRSLKRKSESLQRLMRYRNILLAWFPYLAGMSPLFPKTETIKVKDIYRVRYELTLDKEVRPPLQLLKN